MPRSGVLFEPLTLPCGVTLKCRIVKSAMSDSLGDGTGHPTPEQMRLYRRWAEGGAALSIIGEVQGSPDYAEKPGNLVLDDNADPAPFRELARQGSANGARLWTQLGHAGALAYAPTSDPKGPSALDLTGLRCAEMSVDEIQRVPYDFARTAGLAKQYGFGGVQIHAAHGFLLSQFLSPLFNRRTDNYGGSIDNRMRLLLDSIAACRDAVGPDFPIAVKLNSSDMLEGGFDSADSLAVVAALDSTSIDLIDISGGTYFPGARSASDGSGRGPYFLEFARRARLTTDKPLMLTGGFRTFQQAEEVIAEGCVDIAGLARAMALDPALPNHWRDRRSLEPEFPRFPDAPEGGITAWYTMRLTEIGHGRNAPGPPELEPAIQAYDSRDQGRTAIWLRHFFERRPG